MVIAFNLNMYSRLCRRIIWSFIPAPPGGCPQFPSLASSLGRHAVLEMVLNSLNKNKG